MGEYFELDRRTGFSGFSDVEVLPKDNASSKRGSQQKLELASQNRNPGSFWAFLPVFRCCGLGRIVQGSKLGWWVEVHMVKRWSGFAKGAGFSLVRAR
jgi:hypothetical protein